MSGVRIIYRIVEFYIQVTKILQQIALVLHNTYT